MPRVELQSVLPWGLALVALLGLVVVLVVYRIWLRALPGTYRGWILALRALFLGVILLLLFDPRIEWTRRVLVPPRLGVFLDNSLSMANHPDAAATTVFSQVASVVEWAHEHNYQPVIMTFGEQLSPRADLRFEYLPNERLTDFGTLVDIWQTGDLQAGFVFSDGVATSGIDPGAVVGDLRVPIHTVGIGDTSTGLDLSILDIRYPLSLLEQEQSTLRVTVRASNAAGKRSRLYFFHENQLIHSERIEITSRDYIRTFETPVVGRLGAPHFRVELMVLTEEANIDNNRREFQIDVLPGRRQVTIVTGALSPNTAFIGQVVKRTQHAVVNQLIFLRGNWYGEESRFWSTPQDLVVLDNYPTPTLPEGDMDRLLAKLRRDKTPVLVVEGPDNLNRDFVRLMRFLGLRVEVDGDGLGTLHPLLPVPQTGLKGVQHIAPGRYSVDFPPSSLVHILEPMSNRGMAAVLHDDQKRLVISYGVAGGVRKGILLLPDLVSTHLKLNRTGWNDFLVDVLQGLVEWELEPEGFSPYVVQPDRQQYHLGEKVLFRGIMRDRAGIKMLQPVLTVEVQGPEDTLMVPLTYNFDAGEYEGEFWPGESGSYRIRVYDGGDSGGGSARTSFQVQAGRVELEFLAQNRYGLERLAQSTGGRYTDLQGVEQLLAGLAYAARTVTREYRLSLWQFRYLLAVLVLLLGLEWILRRAAGLI